jgi:hypothetical protein
MRFPLNSGQTNAVKTKPRLDGETVGPLMRARAYKESTSGIQAEY